MPTAITTAHSLTTSNPLTATPTTEDDMPATTTTPLTTTAFTTCLLTTPNPHEDTMPATISTLQPLTTTTTTTTTTAANANASTSSPTTPVPPSSSRRLRSGSFPKPDTTLYDLIQQRAEREIEWYFETPADRSRRPQATACIEGWLAALPTFYRSAITLRYDTTRVWPARVRQAFAPYTAIAVRFYGAQHPTVGSVDDVEQALAQKLDALIASEGDDSSVYELDSRASAFFDKAVVAFMKARGTGKCVAPWTRVRRPRPPPPPPGPPEPRMVARLGRTGLIERVPLAPPVPNPTPAPAPHPES